MARRIQYQDIAQPPVRVLPQAQQSNSWFQSWTDPVRYAIAPAMAVALVASGPVTPPPQVAPATTDMRWYQPLSEPVRVAARDAWFQPHAINVLPLATPNVLASTSPVDYEILATVQFQYPTSASLVQFAPFAETVTESRWHQPWSEPIIKSLPRDAWYQAQVSFVEVPPFAETVTESRWHQPWSEPVRVAPRDAWFQPDTRSLQPVVSFSYYQPLTEPVRVAPRDAWFQPDTLTRTQSDVTGIQYPPLSEPVRAPLRDAWYQPDTFARPLFDATSVRYLPLSEPVRTAARDAWYQPDTFGRAAPFPETVTESRWHQPWSEPIRTAARAAWYQDAASWNPSTPPAVSTAVTPVSPVDYGIFSEFRLQYQVYTAPVTTAAAEVITVSKWFVPWQDPVRVAARDAWFQPDTFGRAAPFPEEVSEDRWHQPWSEPVRTAPRDAWFQFTALAPNPVVSFSYYGPLSEPITKSAARDAWYQPDTLTRTASDVTGIQYPALSEPVRIAPRDAWFNPVVLEPISPVISIGWFQPWTDPVRTPPRTVWFQPDTLTRTASDVTGIQYLALSEPVRTALRDAWYQPDTRSLSTVFPEEVSEDRWHQPWSEPVRVAPRDAWYQDATSFWPFPIPNTATPADSWFAPFSDPVRVAPRDVWFQPDVLGRAAPFPEEVSEDRWHQPWSEPVRTLPRDAWFTFATVDSVNPNVSFSYFNWLTEPVIKSLPRDAWFQPDTIGRPASDVTGVQYLALAEPIRVLPRDTWFQPIVVEPTQPVVSFSWFSALSEPVRTPPRAAWFQPDTLTRTASDVTGIQYTPLSEPVRTALRDAWYQDATSFNPFPLPNAAAPPDSWLPYFDDFARPAARVAWSQYQSFADGAVVPASQVINILQSWEPYTDPVRLPFPVAVYVPWDAYIDSVDVAPPDTGKVWRRYWIQDDPDHILNRDAPHDLVWAEEDEIAILIGLL